MKRKILRWLQSAGVLLLLPLFVSGMALLEPEPAEEAVERPLIDRDIPVTETAYFGLG